MHAGLPITNSVRNENLSGKLISDPHKNQCVFPALNVLNNFVTINYDTHINTKLNYTFIRVFRFMTVHELNTRHTVCELERNQLLTILEMSV